MPGIAQAVVNVRPDLTGFAGLLRTELEKQLKLVGAEARTITLNAKFAPGTQAALQSQLNKMTGLRVEVVPFITKKSINQLRAEIGIVPIDVALAGGQAQRIANQVSNAAGVPAPGSPRQRAARAVQEAPDASLAVLNARKALEAETVSLQQAELNLANATAALAAAELREQQQNELGSTNRARLASVVTAQGKDTVALAEAQAIAAREADAQAKALAEQAAAADLAEQKMLILAESNDLATVSSEKQALAAIGVAEALDKQAIAVEKLALARQQGAAASVTGPLERQVTRAGIGVQAAQAKQQDVLDAEAAAANAPALAAQRDAEASAARVAAAGTAADERALAVKKVLAQEIKTVAQAEDLVARAIAAERAQVHALEVAQAELNEAQIKFRTSEAATASEVVRNSERRLAAIEAQVEAERQLGLAQQKVNEIALVGQDIARTPLSAAKASRSLAGKGAEFAGEAATQATAAGNAELARQATNLQAVALGEKAAAEASIERINALKAQEPVARRINQIQNQLALGANADESLAVRRRASIRADQLATTTLAQFSTVLKQAEAPTIALTQELQGKARAQLLAVDADIAAAAAADKAAAAAAKQATVLSQAQRGATATGATFLGLRGAVLSASGGFLAATVAVTALAKVIGTASQLQQSFNVFQSVSGATAEQMAKVSAEATSLGKDLTLPATSANDAAEAFTSLSKAGLSVNDTLAAGRGVLELSAAAQISVGDASNIVATQLNAFGLAGTEATKVADLLAGASIEAQGEITDFALAFQQVAAVAHQVELPLSTTTAVLTQFARAGLRGSDAGTSLRTLLLRLVPTTKAAAQAQEDLGIRINRSIPIGQQFSNLIDQYSAALSRLGPIAQQEALTKIFGQDAIRGASITLTQSSQALALVESNVSQAGLAGELADARMKGLSGSVEGLKSNVETLAATLGTTLLPVLTSIATTLTDVVSAADDAAKALSAVGDVTIKPLVDILPGGTDTLAQVGLALGAGLGLKKLIDSRRKAVEVAKTTDAEILESTVVMEEQRVIAVNSAGEAQITTAKAVADAEVAASERAGAAAGRAAKRAKEAALSNKALGISIAAIIAGQALQDQGGTTGRVGGAVSTIGTTALIGNSILPGGAGAIIGAGAGVAIAGLKEGQRDFLENQAQWNALTYPEQIAALKEIAGVKGGFLGPKAGQFLSVFGLELKTPPPIPASAFAALPTQAIPTLDLSNINQGSGLLRTSLAFPSLFTTPEFSKIGGNNGDTQKAISLAQGTARAEAELQLALAQAADDKAGSADAINQLIKLDQNRLKALDNEINSSIAHETPEHLKQIVKDKQEQTKLVNEIAGFNKQLDDALKKAFTVPTDIQVAVINAGPTKTLDDNLAAQERVAAATKKALIDARNAKKKNVDEINRLTIASAQADADVASTQNQINDQAKAAAAQAISDQAAKLQIAADAAGNIGAAENKYIAFLKEQTQIAGQTTQQEIAATKAYNDEIDKRANALQAVVDASVSLRDKRTAFLLQIAQSTPGIKDDATVLNRQIADDRKDIIAIQARIKSEHAKGLLLIKLQSQIVDERADIFAKQQAIKGLQSDSGFSLQDLFQESVKQFTEFSSNVSQGGVSTGGAARAAVAGGILAQRPGVQDRLHTVSQDQLKEATRTNQLLSDILTTLKPDTKGGTSVDDQTAGSTKADRARRLGRVSFFAGHG